MSILPVPLVPKDPNGPLCVIAIGRLSKPKDDEVETQLNLESSLVALKRHLSGIYSGRIELTELFEQESGLIADRETALKAMDLIATGKIDLVISEDLSRIFRNPRFQYIFVQDAVDAETRVICFADNLDTADENWELMMGVASLRHGMTIPDIRRRQKRKATFSFHNGGQVQKIRFGYRKLSNEEATSGEFGPPGLRMAKLPEATPIIKKMVQLLTENLSYVLVLDWLRENDIGPGPYASSNHWTQSQIKDLLTDPILVGTRQFRKQLYQRIYKSGRFRRKANPQGPETENYPELAHLTKKEFENLQEIIQLIAESNGKVNDNPRKGVPRSDAIFPRQHATCAICGERMFGYGVHQMKCQNANKRVEKPCWNHVHVDTRQAQAKIFQWVLTEATKVGDFRKQLLNFSWEELQKLQSESIARNDDTNHRRTNLTKQADAIAHAISQGGELPSLLRQLKDIESMIAKLPESKDDSKHLPVPSHSKEEIDARLDEVLSFLAGNSFRFAAIMRTILPVIDIFPVQAFDTGLVRPRARVVLQIKDSLDGSENRITADINLFDPPKHIQFLDDCIILKKVNPAWSLKRIASEINRHLAKQGSNGEAQSSVSYMTIKRCFDTARKMKDAGLSEPYKVLTSKPSDASRWKIK